MAILMHLSPDSWTHNNLPSGVSFSSKTLSLFRFLSSIHAWASGGMLQCPQVIYSCIMILIITTLNRGFVYLLFTSVVRLICRILFSVACSKEVQSSTGQEMKDCFAKWILTYGKWIHKNF